MHLFVSSLRGSGVLLTPAVQASYVSGVLLDRRRVGGARASLVSELLFLQHCIAYRLW